MKVKCELDVLSFYYPYHKELKEEILKYLQNYPDKQNKSTNVKATMTEWNITTPQIEILKSFILSNIFLFNPMLKTCEFKFDSFWANIYDKGEYTISHDHLPCYFSFVYFLQSKIYYPPLIFSDTKKKILPKEGNFIIFPSIIKHEVPKHKYNKKRITLAGNIDIVR